MSKTTILKAYLWLMSIFLLFWWPLSHWFYPAWYHTLLGFEAYDDAFVKVIGTTGMMPVLGLFIAAQDPHQHKGILTLLIAFSVLMASTYVFLIQMQAFPYYEYVNVGLCIVSAVLLLLLYPVKKQTNIKP